MKLSDEDIQRIAEAVAQKLEKPPVKIQPPTIYITNPIPSYIPNYHFHPYVTC